MSKETYLPINPEKKYAPEFRFTNPETNLFLTGVSLSGKSSIATFVSSSIEDCTHQSMDIIRLVAKRFDERKPIQERNPFLTYGSCDSYFFVGDGSYSPKSLVEGYNRYSQAVFSALTELLPGLDKQGESNLLLDGVQLTPLLVAPYLTGDNKLIIVTSSEDQLLKNRGKKYGDNLELINRYSLDRLLLIQEEILKQSIMLPPDKVMYVSNTGAVDQAVASINTSLLENGTLQVI